MASDLNMNLEILTGVGEVIPKSTLAVGKPTYLPSRVETFLEQVLFTPEHEFHPQFAPQPRCIGVYGREGLNKTEVIESFLKERGLDTWVIHCESKKTQQALNELDVRLKAQSEFPNVQSVVIFDKADRLIYDAESEEAASSIVTEFDWFLAHKNNRLICVFDRIPNEECNKLTYQQIWNTFFKSFDAEVFFPAPPRSFRIAYFKYAIAEFLKNRTGIENKMTEADYECLADQSQFATIQNIDKFLCKPFYQLIYKTTTVVDLALFQDLMHQVTEMNGKYINQFSFHRIEDMFSTALQNGPTVVNKEEIKRMEERRRKEKLEEEKLIAFDEENVNLDKAKEEIKKKKKVSKKRDATPEIPEQEYPDPLAGIDQKGEIVISLEDVKRLKQ